MLKFWEGRKEGRRRRRRRRRREKRDHTIEAIHLMSWVHCTCGLGGAPYLVNSWSAERGALDLIRLAAYIATYLASASGP